MSFYDDSDALIHEFFDENAQTVTMDIGGTTLEFRAVRAGTTWGALNGLDGPVSLEVNSRDFLVRSIDVRGLLPCVKDKITDAEGTWTVYKTSAEGCWRYMGRSKNFMRIHCKK